MLLGATVEVRGLSTFDVRVVLFHFGTLLLGNCFLESLSSMDSRGKKVFVDGFRRFLYSLSYILETNRIQYVV